MPLAPLPANNTKRYFLVWNVSNVTHHTTIRVVDDFTDAEALAAFQSIFSPLNTLMKSGVTSIIDLEVAQKGSDIRNPVAGWTTIAGTSVGNFTGQDFARSWSFRGRSPSGRKVKMLIWGLTLAEEPDFRLSVGTNQTFTDLIATFNNSGRAFITIDGTAAFWHDDVLEDYNDHWEHVFRRTPPPS